MVRKKEEDKDDVEISEKSGLICLILGEIDLMALMMSRSWAHWFQFSASCKSPTMHVGLNR